MKQEISVALNFGLIQLIGLLSMFPSGSSSEAEHALRRMLFENYDRISLPVENTSDILNIEFGLAISQIIDLDEKGQTMTTKVWVNHSWNDHHLKWNPNLHDGISSLIIPAEDLWIPDILIYNNADGNYHIKNQAMARVLYNGTVVWVPPAIYKSSCKIDVEYFPFDEQKCVMKFGSWTYGGLKIDLFPSSNNAQQRDYWSSAEWDILGSPGAKHKIKYPCCEEIYVDITYTLELRRKPLFYVANLLLPCALISFSTAFVFFLPSDCGEKISLCTSIMLALSVFLLLITKMIPANATTMPLIVKYLLFTMVIVSASIVFTVFVLNIHYRSPTTHVMRPWVRKVFIDTLPYWLCMQRPERYNYRYRNVGISITKDILNTENIVETNKLVVENTAGSNNFTVRMRNEMDDGDHSAVSNQGLRLPEKIPSRQMNDSNAMGDAKNIDKAIQKIMCVVSKFASEEDYAQEKDDWKYVAMVVDRIFLIIFISACFVGTISLIMQAPLASTFFHEQLFG